MVVGVVATTGAVVGDVVATGIAVELRLLRSWKWSGEPLMGRARSC